VIIYQHLHPHLYPPPSRGRSFSTDSDVIPYGLISAYASPSSSTKFKEVADDNIRQVQKITKVSQALDFSAVNLEKTTPRKREACFCTNVQVA